MLEPLDIPYQGKLRMGTCSWKYDSWKGIVYQDRKYRPFDYLTDYARYFNTNTADFTLLRLHGSDRSGIEQKTQGLWHQIIEPQDARLAAAVDITQAAVRSGVDVYVNVNNHYEGCGPLTIQRLLARMV